MTSLFTGIILSRYDGYNLEKQRKSFPDDKDIRYTIERREIFCHKILIQNISSFFYEKKSGKNMGTIHNLIKRIKSTYLVFQRCENKSSFFSVNKWILLLGKISKRCNVCKKTYKVCTTTCDHRELLWQIKVEASCSS